MKIVLRIIAALSLLLLIYGLWQDLNVFLFLGIGMLMSSLGVMLGMKIREKEQNNQRKNSQE